MLATGDEPIRNIAEKTGFSNEFHLRREITRIFLANLPDPARRIIMKNRGLTRDFPCGNDASTSILL